jgi:hypothetical protein
MLGRALVADVAANPGKTGIYLLSDPRDAFAARSLFADAAEKSLDAQYFTWHGDEAGYQLFQSLWQAAERGVRVRLLLDDFYTAGLDPLIAALDGHRNVEVRLYNPLVQRTARMLNLATDFTRVNRRMHNKSFTVDNQVSIVGIAAGLIAGKPLGVTFLCFVAVASGICQLPSDLKWSHVVGAGILGGIGFTMSIFIANLAFSADPQTINASKMAILLASLVAGVLGFLWLRLVGQARAHTSI